MDRLDCMQTDMTTFVPTSCLLLATTLSLFILCVGRDGCAHLKELGQRVETEVMDRDDADVIFDNSCVYSAACERLLVDANAAIYRCESIAALLALSLQYVCDSVQ